MTAGMECAASRLMLSEGGRAVVGQGASASQSCAVAPPVQELTEVEILELIDQRARFLLGMSGEEFMRRYRAGELEYTPVEGPIVVLAGILASD